MNYLLFLAESVCDNSSLLKIFYFGKELINLAFMIIPAGSILVLSFDLFKNVISNNEGAQKKNLSIFIRRIIFMVVVFLIPTIVGFMVRLVDDALGNENNNYLKCIQVDVSTIKKQVASEKAKCTSTGNEWDSKSEVCKEKITASETVKQINKKIKESNSSLKYSTDNKISSNDNSSSNDLLDGKYPIAAAALSMAYSSESKATGDYGTKLYVYAYDHVLRNESAYRTGKKKEASTGSTRYRSCSEAVTVFVRYSGVDDDFAKGDTSPNGILSYVRSSSKWKQVNWNGDYSKLQPGDVFVDTGHAMLYVGKKALHKYFPKAPKKYNLVQASYSEDYINQAKSPYIMERTDLATDRWINNAFRCVNPDKTSKYAKYRK